MQRENILLWSLQSQESCTMKDKEDSKEEAAIVLCPFLVSQGEIFCTIGATIQWWTSVNTSEQKCKNAESSPSSGLMIHCGIV